MWGKPHGTEFNKEKGASSGKNYLFAKMNDVS